jgi:hypothetical protein
MMSREEAMIWCGFYGLAWPKRGEVSDADAFLDAADIRLASVDEERAGSIMQALYAELT